MFANESHLIESGKPGIQGSVLALCEEAKAYEILKTWTCFGSQVVKALL